jgi:hypothetical protein
MRLRVRNVRSLYRASLLKYLKRLGTRLLARSVPVVIENEYENQNEVPNCETNILY